MAQVKNELRTHSRSLKLDKALRRLIFCLNYYYLVDLLNAACVHDY